MSALEAPETRRAELRWVVAGTIAAAALLVLQVAGGLAREALSDTPSHKELVETCLIERDIPFEAVVDDIVALSAERGALRAILPGNAVTVALGGSERDAERVVEQYTALATPDVVERLERSRKVVFLWAQQPTAAQRELMALCTLDAQD